MIPQVKSTVLALVTILLGAPLLTCWQLHEIGELKTWSALPDALNHGLWSGLWFAVGWLLFKSPVAGKFTELLATSKAPDGTVKELSVKIQEPAKEPKVQP